MTYAQKYAGASDENNVDLFLGQRVLFKPTGQIGTVVDEFGASGIAFETPVDWQKVKSAMNKGQSRKNNCMACFNDNFISFWEIAWNFQAEGNAIPGVVLLKKDR